ncbi:MAG: MerR family transcriptional regulator [Chloroflexi bacterium]|nr:MerR family transcriptional regulator [Chloroflexota bacterium]
MFKIGDFSKLSQLSVKTLRYYDELGLLKPVEVDRFTGYRYYSADQLPRLNRILALKDLGLSLEQIASLLDDDLPAAQIRGMLRLKQSEMRERVKEEQARLARVEARLRQIEQEGKMPTYEVVIKKVPTLRVASLRGIIPSFSEQGEMWNELETYLGQQRIKPIGPCLTLYHDTEYKDHDVDAEVSEPVEASVRSNSARIKVYDLPAVESMASTVHHGPFNTLSQAYNALMQWIQTNGYRICGPDREIYVKANEPPRQDDPSYVTEIQIPVEKV